MTRKRAKPRPEIATLPPPRLNDPPEEMADWAECWSLISRDGNTSFSELRSVMKIGGSADAFIERDAIEYAEVDGAETVQGETAAADRYEAAAEAAFREIFERESACGDTNYPFSVCSERISAREDTNNSAYVFLLLLSKYGPDAGPKKSEGAKLFEEVCAHAVMSFLGGKGGLADAEVFGFPRRVACNGFSAALDTLCRRLAEGEGSRSRPTTQDQKDAKLDVVGWKSFRDRKKGRLIIFGQCATGGDWRNKRSELIATFDWCRHWMKDTPAVLPLRAFFVPHSVGDSDWLETCLSGGLLFDRCRIAYHANGLSRDIEDKMVNWSKLVIKRNRGN